MKNKQIIVDGINISECEFCEWKGSNIPQCRIRSASFESICEGYKCYYKQLQREKQNSQEARGTAIKEFNKVEELKTLLKRKEQECEGLKEENFTFEQLIKEYEKYGAIEEIVQQLKQLKAENEELKKELEAIYDDCKGCPTCNEALYNANLYAKEYRKLKQTLAEIKEITKNMNKECFYNDFSCDDCDMINGCTYKGKLSVLQKISECEVENAKN